MHRRFKSRPPYKVTQVSPLTHSHPPAFLTSATTHPLVPLLAMAAHNTILRDLSQTPALISMIIISAEVDADLVVPTYLDPTTNVFMGRCRGSQARFIEKRQLDYHTRLGISVSDVRTQLSNPRCHGNGALYPCCR